MVGNVFLKNKLYIFLEKPLPRFDNPMMARFGQLLSLPLRYTLALLSPAILPHAYIKRITNYQNGNFFERSFCFLHHHTFLGGGFRLENEQNRKINVVDDWQGIIWGRTFCDNRMRCATGGCAVSFLEKFYLLFYQEHYIRYDLDRK